MGYLKDYVTANDSTRYDGLAEGRLRLDVTHSNLEQRWHDILFDESMTVMGVKEKLYRHGGTSCCMQELYLRRGPGDTIYLDNDDMPLSHYGCYCGMEIHIKDLDPHSLSANGGLEDVSQVEKYVMADEEYDKMKNTVRAVKREREQQKAKAEQAARQAAGGEEGEGQELGGGGWRAGLAADGVGNNMTMDELQAAYPVGGRCEADPGFTSRLGRLRGPLGGPQGLLDRHPFGRAAGSERRLQGWKEVL